jgi:hypothetical protein
MRKVEARMIQAIRHLANWPTFEGRYLKCDNTEVWQECTGILRTSSFDSWIVVKLHGHTIAKFWPAHNCFKLFDCGWQTATTKSRLNALILAFSPYSDTISQVRFCWYLGKEEWESGAEFNIHVKPNNYILRLAEKVAG